MHDPLVVIFTIRRPWPQARNRYFPPIVTIWHREPHGHDSGEICKHRARRPFHIHHWRIQIHPLQHLRRWALTRCAWCGGHSRKGDHVNISHQWDGPRGRWWQGEPGLFHDDCSSIERSHSKCFCPDPLLSQDGYGQCQLCGKFRAWRDVPDEADRLLAALPPRSRIPTDKRPLIEAAWAERRERHDHGR